MKPVTALFGAVGLSTLVAAAPTHQFDKFFPAWDPMIQEILRGPCAEALNDYKTGTKTSNITVSSGKSAMVSPVIECVLDEFPDFRKAEMAASAVILGLLPTILQTIGSTTAETSLLSLRRPFLAFLLAAGSPAVTNMRGTEFMETIGKFVEAGETRHILIPQLRFSRIPRPIRPFISLAEYLLVGGAVANVVFLAYQLGVNAVVAFAAETVFMVPLWTFIAVVIHFGGMLALMLRVRIVPSVQGRRLERRASGFGHWLPDELVPSAFQPPKRLEWRTESLFFHAVSWLLNIGTMINVVLGTLVLSSLLFFSVVDSLLIVARYAVSTIVCRSVLRFELLGMKEATTYGGTRDEQIELTAGDKNAADRRRGSVGEEQLVETQYRM